MKREHRLLHNLGKLAIALSVAFAISQAQAGMQWWDRNGTTTGAGGPSPNGTWDLTTANWTPAGSSTGTAATTTWVQANTAIFSAGQPAPGDATGSYTITVGGAITAAGLRHYSGNNASGKITYADGGGSITMVGGGAGAFYMHSTGPRYIDIYAKLGSDSGGISFSKAGNGEVTLYNSANNFSGPIDIRSTGMILRMGAAGVIPTGVTMLTSTAGGAILDLNGFSTAFDTVKGNVLLNNLNAGRSFTFRAPAGETYSGAVSGNGDLIKNGSGALTMSGTSSSFNGNLKINQGTLTLSGTLGSSATIDLNGGALTVSTYTLGAGQTLKGGGNITGNINGNGTITPGHSIGNLNVIGALTLSSTANLNMEIDRNGGAFLADKISASSIAEAGTLNILNIGAALQLGDTFDLFDGTLSLSFGMINTPALSDPNWYWDLTGLDAGGDGTIVVALVPEPSTAACFGLGVAALLILRRRKA